MTGAELCRRILLARDIECDVSPGLANAYDPGERLITLRAHVYGGKSAKNLTMAAHEAGHAEQHDAIGWLCPALRWLMLGRLWLEWDASRRAREMLCGMGLVIDEAVLCESWRNYFWPTVWQVLLLAIVGTVVILRA